MKFLVVGAGSIGRRHHDNLQRLGATSTLIGWRNVDLATLEEELIGNALVIATASDVRLELIDIAARVGAPVYVEKPAAVRPADVDRLFELMAPLASRSVVGFMMRYHPVVQKLARDDLGDIYRFSFEIGHDVHQWRDNWSFADSYAAREASGGALLDLCHEIDMATLLFPDSRLGEVMCVAEPEFPRIDFATHVTLRGPANGLVKMDYLAPKSIRRICLRGRNQMRDIDLLTLKEMDLKTGDVHDLAVGFERNDMFLDLMSDFIAIAEGTGTVGPLCPRLDRMFDVCALISRAWEQREFVEN